MGSAVCPIWGSPATLLSTGRAVAAIRIDSPRAGGTYEITLQAEQILAPATSIVTNDDRVAITNWLKSQRSGDNENPPILTRDVIREVTGLPFL